MTSESRQRPTTFDGALRRRTIEASDDAEALGRFVEEEQSELVSLSRPSPGGESIATVKKRDTVYLVRVYAG